MMPTPVSSTAWLRLLAPVELQVRRVEEPYLLVATHEQNYTAYTATVGRFLPGFGRLTPASRIAGLPSRRPCPRGGPCPPEVVEAPPADVRAQLRKGVGRSRFPPGRLGMVPRAEKFA